MGKIWKRGANSLSLMLAVVVLAFSSVLPIWQGKAYATANSLGASEDAFVASGTSADTNFGTATQLNISGSSNRTLLKFNTSAIPASATINSVKLVVNQTVSGLSSGGINVHPGATSWSESAVTWNNQPTWDTTVLATTGTPAAGSMDITLPTSSFTAGTTSIGFGLDYSVGGIVAKISSKEAGSTVAQLVIDYTAAEVSNTSNAKEDAYVTTSSPTQNYGTANPMNISSSSNRSMLKFGTAYLPTGTTVTSVKLRMYSTVAGSSGGIRVHPFASTWSESSVTYNTMPTWDTTTLATSSTPAANSWVEVNLPASSVTVGNSTVSYSLDYSVSGFVAKIASHEDASNAPQLVVTYTPVDSTANLTATADSFIAGGGSSGTNYGTANPLFISQSNNNALLTFDTSTVPVGATVTEVKLVVDQTVSGIAAGGIRAHPSLDTWTESTVTYDNQPTVNTTVLGTSATPGVGSLDIALPTTAVTPGTNTAGFRLSYSTSGVVAKISSRESGSTTAPKLVVKYTVNSATPAPAVTTSSATSVGENAATLGGSVNPNGQASSYYFEYYHNDNTNLSQPYVSRTLATNLTSGTVSQSVSKALATTFAAGTTYYFRIVASNDGGVSYGEYQSFTTSTATAHAIAAGGDMACDPSSSSFNSGTGTGKSCRQMAVSDSIVADTSIEAVLPLGDNAYECGSPGAFEESYDPSWGRMLNKTFPVVGNHEYATGHQVTSSYCRGTLTDAASASASQISVDRGLGETFPATGSFPIRLIKASCAQTSADNTNCYDSLTATVTSNSNVWDITRTSDGTTPLDFAIGDYVTYEKSTDARGYYGYFGDRASPLQPGCTDSCAGYYSYNIGNWHMIALNSMCSSRDKNNNNQSVGCEPGTPQYTWLENDLKTIKPGQGVLAYWHHPRVSSGDHGDHDGVLRDGEQHTDLSSLWNALRAVNADIVLSGHDHNYERFKQLGASVDGVIAPDTDGIRAWVVGNAGKNLIVQSGLPRPEHDNDREVYDNTTVGFLKLTLGTSSYSWDMVAASGTWNGTLTDTGTTNLHTN